LFVSSPVPEPETLSLMVLGLVAVGTARFRHWRARPHRQCSIRRLRSIARMVTA
jgi:hypothetical protein